MKKLLGLLALVLLFGLPTMAQDTTPVFEVGGGFQYRSFDTPLSNRLNMAGWFVTANYNVNRWLGVAAQFDGTRSDKGPNGTWNDYGFMFGPQIYPFGHHTVTPFFHVLLGGSHVNVSFPADPINELPALTETDSAFSFEGGGGVDWTITKHFGVRLGELDYEQQRFFGANPVQHNYKFSAGVVVRFGEK
ncbi:MAG: outer membrane beta-barrel protein [Candidatus Acidiferrales bacterium]